MKSNNIRSILFLFLFFNIVVMQAGKLEKGFEALSIHDYFKAKKLFIKINTRKPNVYAQYGLSVIFNRNNNPFFNLDSARKYAYLSYHLFKTKPRAKTFYGFAIDSLSIVALIDSISQRQFALAKQKNSVEAYNIFLQNNYLAKQNLINQTVYLRDELEFNKARQINRSDSTNQFMLLRPQSTFYAEALQLKHIQIYNETTEEGKSESYINFLNQYPDNALRNTAYEKLFELYRQKSDAKGLSDFVKRYPDAPQNSEAWKLLFSLSVKSFSYLGLKNFLEEYPDFPFKNSILRDLELNKLLLYPFEKGDLTGFVDTTGIFIIAPQYDAATDFYEGLSVVSKNDTVFFINKENANPFNTFYSDAFVFKNGIAPVKQNEGWFFINRQGQSISKLYDEINELSNSVYIVKLNNKYGALDHFGQIILEPKFDKLGDFKNGFAYYVENGNYGFVSKTGAAHKAEFEWISDFSTEQIAVIRQNNKYGLVNTQGKKILEPQYEQIVLAKNSVYIVVQNENYGFFSSQGCFFTPIAYEYSKEKPENYYTNGKLFKLIQKDKQAFVNANGHLEINFGMYDEINFAANDLIRVKKKNKYGYLDRKLAVAIPRKYQQAQDFSDSLAIVVFKDKNYLINTSGRGIFSSEGEIEKLSEHYYTVGDEEVKRIINNRGAELYSNVSEIQKINPRLFILSFENGEVKLLRD